MPKHTPPFVVLDPYTNRNVYPIGHKRADGAFDIVGEINSEGGTPDQQRALADYFVRACNSHYALINALREAVLKLDDGSAEAAALAMAESEVA
jgi:hypothetical protein